MPSYIISSVVPTLKLDPLLQVLRQVSRGVRFCGLPRLGSDRLADHFLWGLEMPSKFVTLGQGGRGEAGGGLQSQNGVPEVGNIVACPGCWWHSCDCFCWCCQSQPHYMSITAY